MDRPPTAPRLVPPAWADALGLAVIFLVLADYLRPALVLLPTIAAGGDTPGHYPTLVALHERLLPELRLHGWNPGAYLGHPLQLYYFPLPFLVMAGLAPFFGLAVAFKLGAALGVALLPPSAYLCLRLLGFRFPAPLLGAAAALVFLFVETNPIWGGTIASTLSGEIAYAYGAALGVLTLGAAYRAYARGRPPWGAAGLLAATALAHGYAVLWAGLSLAFLLFPSRRPLRTLGWLARLAAAAFALAGVTLVPLLWGWRFTTPYDGARITAGLANLFPPLLWPLLGTAALGLVLTVAFARRSGGADQRLVSLAYAAAAAGALAAAGDALGLVGVRFLPFAQLAACLLGAAALGRAVERAAAPDLLALGLVGAAVLWSDGHARVLRPWIAWQGTGLEARDLAPALRAVADELRGGPADPRVAVEYDRIHEDAGSVRAFDVLPLLSGRSALDGLYTQASLSSPAVHYVLSLLGPASPNPFAGHEYGRFDPDGALSRLRLFAAGDIVATSPLLKNALDRRRDVRRRAGAPPFVLYRLEPPPAYVEPLRFAPVRASLSGWREASYRWFTHRPLPEAPLVFTDDPRFAVTAPDPWLAPPAVPLDGADAVEATAIVEPERIRITTSRPGHPLLVKVSYHPRWRAEGALGPFLAAPALMLVVPRQAEVTLRYAARDASDLLGLALTLGALAFLAGAWVKRSRAARDPVAEPMPRALTPAVLEMCEPPPPPRRWGWAVPVSLLVLLVVPRFWPASSRPAREAEELYARAEAAYRAGRFADAAEYARHGLPRLGPADPRRTELLHVRGMSLLKTGRAAEGEEALRAASAAPP